MKNSIILWTSSIVIVIVLSYLKTIFSENYPITGTIGIEGEKITYKLDKEGYGDSHQIVLRSDLQEMIAKIVVIKNDSLITIDFIKKGVFLVAELNRDIVDKSFYYYLQLDTKDYTKRIPIKENVHFRFYGKISKMLSIQYYFFLFIGMILIVRSGLEFFNNNLMSKKLLILSFVVWITFTILINPLYLSYKFEYINHSITPIQNLFPLDFLIILILMIITTILTFNSKFQKKPITLIFSVISLVLYLI